MCVRSYVCMHVSLYVHMQVYMCILHMHVCIHAYCIHIRTYVWAYMHACMYTYIATCTHTYSTYIDKYIATYHTHIIVCCVDSSGVYHRSLACIYVVMAMEKWQ